MDSPAPATNPLLRLRDQLLLFTDLHFWEVVWNPLRMLNKRALGNANVFLRRRHHFPMENARPFAKHALETGARSVIFAGDFTSTATEGEFRKARAFLEFLEGEGAELYIVPGNHDVYTYESLRKRRFEKHMEAWLGGEAFPRRRDLPGGTPVILVRTVCPNLLSSKGFISAEDIEKVAGLLASTDPGPVVVLGHYPLLNETDSYVLTPGRRLRGAAELRRVLGESEREVLHVAGHVHRFSFAADPEFENVRHLTGPAFFNHWEPAGRHGGFVEIGCRADGFDIRHHWKGEAWESEAVQL